MPEVAGSWPEEGTQYVPGAPMEPVQQAYPQQAPYQTQQPYQQQGYAEPQYHQQAQQQQYPQEQTVPQQAVYAEEEQSSLPSEFDHLFRDSAPEGRRAISGRQPMVSGPGATPSPGFQTQQAPQQAQPAQQQQQAPAATAMYNQQPQDYVPGPSLDYNSGGPFSYDGPPGGGGDGKKRTPLIIGAVVAVIAIVGLYLGLSGGGGSGKTNAGSTTSASAPAKSNETAQQEADAVYQLVTEAKQLREDIVGEVGKLRSCDIADAQNEINTTAQARQDAANKVATLPVDKISGASAVLTALQKGWQDSATSDADYAKAAADFAGGGCSLSALKKDSNYQQAEDTSSSADKKNAAELWNSIMTKYEPTIASDGSSL